MSGVPFLSAALLEWSGGWKKSSPVETEEQEVLCFGGQVLRDGRRPLGGSYVEHGRDLGTHTGFVTELPG